MTLVTRAAIAGLALTASACAHAPEMPAGPPDFTQVTVEPSAKARLYADCLAEAVAAERYGRAWDDSTELVLFTCTGPAARRFYDALGLWSAQAGSEASSGGRVFRSTNPVQRDLFGVDVCSSDGANDYRCVISLNAGEFLRP